MLRKTAQLGEGKLGCIIWLLLAGAFAYVAYQAIPVKMKSAEMEEFMTRQAERAGRAEPEQIKAAVLARAQELGLPIARENVDVSKGGGRVRIACKYEVPVSLFVYTYVWKFDLLVDRPVFIF